MAIHHLHSAPSPALDAVIWDYDGTLVASRAADEAAVAELIDRDPAAAGGAELFWALEGEPILARIEMAWPGRGAEILPLFEVFRPPQRFLGITGVLDHIRRAGIAMAVVSSRRRQPLEEGLASSGLRGYVSEVIGLDDVINPKPDPEGLLRALATLGADASRSVFIGDSPLDVEAALRAGVRPWRATWGAPHPVDESDGICIARPREVTRRIEGLLRSQPVSAPRGSQRSPRR